MSVSFVAQLKPLTSNVPPNTGVQPTGDMPSSPLRQVQRAKMALVLAGNPGIPNPELGRQVDAHPNTVSKWRRDWTSHSFHLEDHPRTGRPPIFSPTQIAAIKAVACELPYKLDLPFSRLSLSELQDYLIKQEVVEHISVVIFRAIGSTKET